MAQIVPGMAAKDHTIRAEQSGLTDFLMASATAMNPADAAIKAPSMNTEGAYAS